MLGELGSGGMGAVYRALDTRLRRQVAIKVLHRDLSVSGPRDRFLREARLVSSLSHPNICTVFDIGEEDGDPYLVMELLEGESIKERMERGPVPAEDIREIALRVGLALQAAHARGIVHRDIKPANLFLMRDPYGAVDVKVLDFGLAKLADANCPRQGTVDDLTRTGATVGTVEYMSPEQACGEPLDARSDLFSLGVVLYEMATGSVPFRGATSAVVFSELLNRDPVPPRAMNMNLPASLDSVIRALLIKDRSLRLSSASAMLEALTEMRGERGSTQGVTLADTRSLPFTSSRGHNATETSRQASRTPEPGKKLVRPYEVGVSAGLVVKPTSGDRSDARKRREERAAARPVSVQAPRIAAQEAVAADTNEETVNTGWKLALVAGVLVAVLLTLLIILAMGHVGVAAV